MHQSNSSRVGTGRIANRLIGVILVFAISVTLLVTLIQLKIEYDQDVLSIQKRFVDLAASDVESVAQNVWLLDNERLEVILSGAAHVPDFSHAEIRDESGNIILSVGEHDGSDDIDIVHDLTYQHRGEMRFIGTYHLGASTKNAYDRIVDQAIDILIINAFIIFAVAAVIYWAVDRIVTSHMARMANYARNFSLLNLDQALILDRATPAGGDELSDLVGAINQMRVSLRNSYQEMKKLNEELEVRVKERTRDLATQKTLFESVFQGVPDAMFVVDSNRSIIMCNAAVDNIFGYGADEVVGRKTQFLYENPEEYERQGALRYNAQGGKAGGPYTINYKRKNGDIFPGETVAAMVMDEDGSVLGFLGIIRDVSERNMLQAQLIQSSKMATLGEMATGVAHELNQPLNIIRMAADNIRRKLGKDDIDRDYLADKVARVQKQTERAAAIIDHMRAFGRRSTPELVALDLRAIVDGALEMMGEQLRLSGIDIALDLPEEPVMTKGQPVQLEQVLLNLLSNAKDVLSEKSQGGKQIVLSVSKAPKSKRVSLTVRDTGGGIPEEVIGRVFEPFFTTKEVGRGTGLGLSIVYSLVQEMGGTIEVHNAHGGAEFNVFLPAAT